MDSFNLELKDISMVQFVFRTKVKNMNYARAAGGKLTPDKILRDIDSQSEFELGRHLDP